MSAADPTVERIARDPRLFSFLSVCAGDLDVVLGDARLRLRRAAARGYGLIVADAFSSDAIPVHRITREALALYRSKLAEHGIIAFNVSNSYLDLEPVLGTSPTTRGWPASFRRTPGARRTGIPTRRARAGWVAVARHARDLRAVAPDPRWRDCRGSPGSAPWTDDYSNLLGALDLNR